MQGGAQRAVTLHPPFLSLPSWLSESRAKVMSNGMRYEGSDWADATRSLLRAPTLKRVELHARDLLSRALNGGRVVGFVGAGTSMAYGRLSWRDLVWINQERVLERAGGDQPKAVADLRELLKAQKIKSDGTSKSDEFLPAFQLTEQLNNLLDGPGSDSSKFRSDVANLVKDDNGQLHHILATVLKDKAPGAAELAEGMLPDLRLAECIRDLCNAVEKHNSECTSIANAIRALVPDGQAFTRPYHRFVIALLLSLLKQQDRVNWLNNKKAKGPSLPRVSGLDRSAKPALRADLVPRERDPLRLMLDLRIGRFLTTNYDREIEKLLAEEGFTHLSDDSLDDAGGHGRKDPLAPGSRDLVFDSARTGHLFAFAAHARRREAAVVHLHGRADRPEPLIVTEDDYQRRYLAEHGNRSLMEDSLRAAFTSSPLLFVGSGLGEDDLVRPLRQFVHDPTVGAGRVAVALLPMWYKDSRTEQSTAIRNLQRYGVHTVHYGYVVPDRTQPDKKERWLGPFIEIVGELRKAIGELKLFKEKPAEIDRIKTSIGHHLEDIRGLPGGLAPTNLEGIEVDLQPGLGIGDEGRLLEALVGLTQNEPDRLSDAEFADAVELCLTGIQDAIIGAFLCARLIRVHTDWSEWRDKWLAPTEAEDPARMIRSWSHDGGTIPFRRHHVNLPTAQDISAAKEWFAKSENDREDRNNNRLLRQRFDARAYSPTFLSLHTAMEEARDKLNPEDKGRRVFLLVTHRGVGKGHFATSLAEEAYFKIFLKDLGDSGAWDMNARWPAAMFNLSFSHDVSSTFDRLGAFLQDRGQILAGSNFDAVARAAVELKTDRLGRLEALLRGWGRQRESFGGKRAVVVFNRFGALFDQAGIAKNAQIARVFDLLTSDASKDAPIDLVLLCSDQSIPRQFRRMSNEIAQKSEVLSFVELRERGLSESAARKLNLRMEALVETAAQADNFIHILRPARAILLATSYFPSVAMAIALAETEASGEVINHEQLPGVFAADTAFSLRMNVRIQLETENPSRIPARVSFPVLLAAAARMPVKTQTTWSSLPSKLLNISMSAGDSPEEKFCKKLGTILQQDFTEKSIENRTKFFKLSKRIDLRFKSLFEACGGGRFAFTLVMACAYHHLLPIAEAPESSKARKSSRVGRIDQLAMRRAFEQCMGFLSHIQRTLEGLPRTRRDDLLLERVIDAYRGMHQTLGFPLPRGLTYAKMGMPLFDLMQSILWHLSVVGQPVVTDVLLEIPAIEVAVQLAAAKEIPEEHSARRNLLRNVLVDALFLLEFRCLIFELRPSRPKPVDKPPGDGQRRWAVHRLVQRHAFLTLRAPYVDYANTDQFALTLVNSMPNDVPRLTATAYRSLFDLVASLSAYPEPESKLVTHSVWRSPCPGMEDLRVRAQLLRVALGVVRAPLSITTLLRMDTREPDPVNLPASYGTVRRGVLDEHRLMLLWLLEQADRLSERIRKLPAHESESIQRPFYAEEVVWLHNEIATVALIQGRMADAVAQYNRADEAARQSLEPVESSPLRRLIALNRANADIGRGRLLQADTALRRLISVPNEHPAIRPIALGVLALVQHLRGRKVEAKHEYEGAIAELMSLGRSRASAWILRHHGDMLRSMLEIPDARTKLEQAYTFAVEGNHEDIRHLVSLALIRLELRENDERGSSAAVRRDQHRKLDEAETYGRVMGIAALQCEVAIIRTDLQIRDGDLKTAASVAGGGLALASANDMQIRTTRLLLALCEIYALREQYESAQPLLDAALRLANATEYHSAHQRAAQLQARISTVRRMM
jgi:tetratricopeptide (TPR) repeat protein